MLSADERGRYARHLILPEVGPAGQLRLKSASVLCVDSGGLGSHLHCFFMWRRLVIHSSSGVGCSKARSVEAQSHDLNPTARWRCMNTCRMWAMLWISSVPTTWFVQHRQLPQPVRSTTPVCCLASPLSMAPCSALTARSASSTAHRRAPTIAICCRNHLRWMLSRPARRLG